MTGDAAPDPDPAWPAPVLAGLAEAAGLIEDRFVAIGGDLDGALEILARQAVMFEQLAAQFGGAEADAAAGSLAAAAARIGADTDQHGRASQTLVTLGATMAEVQRRTPLIHAHIRELTVLAMYTRLEGERLGSAATDFMAFSAGLDGSIKAAQTSLALLEREIAAAAALVAGARRDHEAVASTQLAELAAVASRLTRNLDAMQAHRADVGACSAKVAERSNHMSQEVGQAVMALQAGDSTRQRLEHVHALVSLMAASSSPDAPDALGPRQRDELLAVGAALAARQIGDSVVEFSRDVTGVVGTFRNLAEDANATVQLGAAASGRRAEASSVSYLAEVQADMRDIRGSLAALEATRAASQATMRAVLQRAELLMTRAGSLQGLKGEMNIMEVNAALKCSRLGLVGASVAVVTRELRGCGQRTATETEGLMADLLVLTEITQDLALETPVQPSSEIDGMIAGALDTLASIDRDAEAALAALERDGAEVFDLLQRSAAGIVVHDEVARLVEASCAGLPSASTAPAAHGADAYDHAPAIMDMLTRAARMYTMAREREVHRLIVGDAGMPAPELVDEGFDDGML